jgi:hypothetical protein
MPSAAAIAHSPLADAITTAIGRLVDDYQNPRDPSQANLTS